jgi:hypothetical protein
MEQACGLNCFTRSLNYQLDAGSSVLRSTWVEPHAPPSWTLGTGTGARRRLSGASAWKHAAVAAVQLPSFLPPAGVAILGCGTGCCLLALGWSFESVRRYGIQAPRAFTGCGVGIGFGCVGVGQGFGRYVPWAKDTRPSSLRKDLRQSMDDVVRFFRERFGHESKQKEETSQPAEIAPEPNEIVVAPELEQEPLPAPPERPRPRRCIEVRE